MKVIRYPLAILFAAMLLMTNATFAAEEQVDLAEQKMVSVNLNTASAEELAEKLQGVGESRAKLIVQYRENKGGFSTVEQLLEIKGVGVATLEKNRDRIQL